MSSQQRRPFYAFAVIAALLGLFIAGSLNATQAGPNLAEQPTNVVLKGRSAVDPVGATHNSAPEVLAGIVPGLVPATDAPRSTTSRRSATPGPRSAKATRSKKQGSESALGKARKQARNAVKKRGKADTSHVRSAKGNKKGKKSKAPGKAAKQWAKQQRKWTRSWVKDQREWAKKLKQWAKQVKKQRGNRGHSKTDRRHRGPSKHHGSRHPGKKHGNRKHHGKKRGHRGR